ncbi:MAG: fibronectin type III domain-containing protein [Chitinophagaceae bacterium]|nr:fibronectin type III domain-containing protein [Chitinophagaceae bacterium]
MYCSGNANAFVRWSNPQTGSTFTSVTMSGLSSGRVSAVKVSPYTNHTVFFSGGGSGITPSLIKATAANATPAFTSIIGAGMTTASANISCIELGTNEQNIIVVYSNYGVSNVWVTSNGGTTWTAIDGNLPDMPVRWAMFYPGDNTKAIIATETGIWQTTLINGASTAWDPETGFPNVRTDMLQYRASDGLLSAATHGRGLFTTIIGAAPSCGTVSGLAASAITNTTATVSWTALGGALNYDVDYKLNSSGTWINAATATTSLSVALSGLTQGSLYDYRVRANCTGATGAYAQAQFTTTSPASCNAPAGLASSAITASSATVSWGAVSGAANYDVDYKLNSSGTWINAATATASTSVGLSGLTASSLYDWRVRANCTAIGLSSAYAQAQFTTTAVITCPGPLDVSTNGTAAGAATIPFNTDVKGTISPTGDNDYYKFVITTGGTATITLTTLPFDYDLKLYSSNGTSQLAISQAGGTTSETITRTYTAGTYYAHVYGYNGATSASLCYTLRVQLGTATQQEIPSVDNSKLTVKVFPNPVADKLTVYLTGDNTRKNLVMYNVNGKVMYSQTVTDMFTTMDVRKIPGGVYYLKLTDTDGNLLHSEKFVKQ